MREVEETKTGKIVAEFKDGGMSLDVDATGQMMGAVVHSLMSEIRKQEPELFTRLIIALTLEE